MLKDNIKKLRMENGLSQDDLAERVHVVRQTVSKWERGTSIPDADALVALADAFGVTPNELLDDSAVESLDCGTAALQTGLMRATMAQKDRMEMIYRRTILVLAAFCVVVLVSIVVLLVNYETGSFTRGFEEGFNLEGTYQVSESSLTIVSFGFTDMESREGLWQLAKVRDQEVVNGYFEPTHDPNMFTLLDESRKVVGWANLAYATDFAGRPSGLLYVQYGDEPFRAKKKDNGVTHYDKDTYGLTVTMLGNMRRLAAPDDPANNDWAEEWFER